MRKLVIALLCIVSIPSFSQNLRLNFMGGLSNYYGELQTKKLTFQQANGVVGVGASIDLSNKLLLRGDLLFSKLGADDKKGLYPVRNLNFKTNITEFDLLAEYNLFDLSEKRFTPYIFAGVGVYKFNPYTFDSANRKVYLAPLGTEGQGLPQYPDRRIYKTTQINFPVGGGLKYAISEDVQFSFEYGLRITTTDYLDDVSKTYVDRDVLLNARGPLAVDLAYRGDEVKNNPGTYPRDGSMRGSPRVQDLYYFGLARLSIRMNWFEDRGYGRRNKMGCPW